MKKPIVFYGWIVVWLSFFTMLVAYSVRYNFSMFYVAILEDFKWGRGRTAAGFSINLIIYALSCPIVGNLIDRYGIKKVVPTGAVVLGLALAVCSQITTIWQFYVVIGVSAFGSCAMGYVPHVPMIANWFTKRRGLALGILSAGITASAIIAPLIQYLISSLGWQGAFLVLGITSAVIVGPIVAIFQRQQPENSGSLLGCDGEGNSPNEQFNPDDLIRDREWASREWTFSTTIRAPRFWWLILMCLFLGLYTYTFLAHQVAYFIDVGFAKIFAANIVSIFSVLATISSVCAFISDRLGREVTFSIGSSCSLVGVTAMMLIRTTAHPWMPVMYAIIFGFGFGLAISMMAVTSADLFQGEHLGAINGMAMASFVLGGAIGPWFAGHIFDVTGSYGPVFPIIYFSILASTAFIWLASPRKVRMVPGRVNADSKRSSKNLILDA